MFSTRNHRSPEWRASTRRRKTKWRIAATAGALGLIALAVPGFAKRGDDGCAKIENQAIGVERQVLAVGDATVTFSNWETKDGEPGEFTGFDYSVDSGLVEFTVKAGRDRFAHGPGSAGSFELSPSPDGRLRAISHVEVCPVVID